MKEHRFFFDFFDRRYCRKFFLWCGLNFGFGVLLLTKFIEIESGTILNDGSDNTGNEGILGSTTVGHVHTVIFDFLGNCKGLSLNIADGLVFVCFNRADFLNQFRHSGGLFFC